MTLGDVGQIVLWLTLALAAYGLVAAIVAALSQREAAPDGPGPLGDALLKSARNAAFGVAALATLGGAMLLAALLTHDFSLKYVAQVSTRDAPADVTITGFWGGQAGSLLFWAWGMTLVIAVALRVEFARNRPIMPAFLGAAFVVQCFFFFLLAGVTNPFEKLPVPVPDGRGLNPLLWDDGMRIHPPLLLSGYMSFTAPFALAVGALVSGRLGREWLPSIRRWMLLAWAIQGAGLLAGAWWAYHVLGWGGYWGWDPVENVALLPWLTATAFLHSVMVQERRGMLKVWNVSLVLASFCLAIFGTFVVRSGVLNSVHSFAQSSIGPFFFAFLGLVVAVSIGLLLYRLPHLQAEAQFDSIVSRESSFLLNNLLFVATAVATLWGTVFPLVAAAASDAKVSVGAPFYERVNGPMLLALLLVMGLGPPLAWRRTPLPALWRTFRGPLLTAAGVGVVLFAAGVQHGLALLAFAAAGFTTAATVGEFLQGMRVRRALGEPPLAALGTAIARNRRRYGGYVVHLGMVLLACGIVASHFYQREVVATLAPGESLRAGRYTLTLRGLAERSAPGLSAVYATVALRNGEATLPDLMPERRIHRNWEQQPITGVALETTRPWLDDVYVLLAGWDDAGRATLRVFINPLVSLIWIGGAVFVAGTLLSAWPALVVSRRRRPVLQLEVAPHAA